MIFLLIKLYFILFIVISILINNVLSLSLKAYSLAKKLDKKTIDKVNSNGFSSSSSGFGNKNNKISSSPNVLKNEDIKNVKTNENTMYSANLEKSIQNKINSIDGLRETMKLQEDIDDFKMILSKMTSLDKTLVTKETYDVMDSKEKQLESLRSQQWSKQNVLSKLLEITWDESAQFRFERHQNKDTSKDIHDYMISLAKIIAQNEGNVLDVGCGDGILLKYLHLVVDKSIESRVTGVDLSQEMIRFARQNFPLATYVKTNLLDYQPEKKFSTVVFNECLHNFLNVEETLKYVELNLITDESKIIISHPRGYDNLVSQYIKNRWLVPSLLPKNEQEWGVLLKNTRLKINQKYSSFSVNGPYLYVLELIK